jgi:hypothetical protein
VNAPDESSEIKAAAEKQFDLFPAHLNSNVGYENVPMTHLSVTFSPQCA